MAPCLGHLFSLCQPAFPTNTHDQTQSSRRLCRTTWGPRSPPTAAQRGVSDWPTPHSLVAQRGTSSEAGETIPFSGKHPPSPPRWLEHFSEPASRRELFHVYGFRDDVRVVSIMKIYCCFGILGGGCDDPFFDPFFESSLEFDDSAFTLLPSSMTFKRSRQRIPLSIPKVLPGTELSNPTCVFHLRCGPRKGRQ